MELWTALLVGFLGSFHCVGMCGPIALALPGVYGAESDVRIVSGMLVYNFGRIITYSLLGFAVGTAGYSLALGGFQSLLSVLLGVAIVTAVILKGKYTAGIAEKTGLDVVLGRIKQALRYHLQKRNRSGLLTVGVLNGLLPCGFVYVGLAGAVSTVSVTESALYMALFGVGTFPAMITVALLPGLVSLKMRSRITRFLPLLTLLFGLFLVWRGLMSLYH